MNKKNFCDIMYLNIMDNAINVTFNMAESMNALKDNSIDTIKMAKLCSRVDKENIKNIILTNTKTVVESVTNSFNTLIGDASLMMGYCSPSYLESEKRDTIDKLLERWTLTRDGMDEISETMGIVTEML